MKGKYMSEEEKDAVKERNYRITFYYLKGLTISEIASRFNISNTHVSRILKPLTTKVAPEKRGLIGEKFGKLSVTGHSLKSNGSINRDKWICLCDCGKEVTICTSELKSGHRKSCGCYKKETQSRNDEMISDKVVEYYLSGMSLRKIEAALHLSTKTIRRVLKSNSVEIRPVKQNLLGDRFGRLRVIRTAPNYKNQVKWVCLCDCGNETITSTMSLKNGDTQSCGCYKIEASTTHGQCKGIKFTPEYILYTSAKKRAKDKNLEFSIELSDIVIPEFCPVFKNIRLENNVKTVGFNSPTLDRLIPELGYIKGNVNVISHKANSIKQNALVDEIRQVLFWVEEKVRDIGKKD